MYFDFLGCLDCLASIRARLHVTFLEVCLAMKLQAEVILSLNKVYIAQYCYFARICVNIYYVQLVFEHRKVRH